ncbi:MAG: hypothetical protein Q9M33_13025, partial [Robiginitomaculum sp.]|nr:hypothetical protein [Robiginitomaculum sp.]
RHPIALLIRKFRMAVATDNRQIIMMIFACEMMQLHTEWIRFVTGGAFWVSGAQALVNIFKAGFVVGVLMSHWNIPFHD